MDEKISLKKLLETFKRRLWLIVLLTVGAGLISGLVSYFYLTPVYEASTQILVNQKNDNQNLYNQNQLQTDVQLINTYNVIIKSPAILDEVVKELNLKVTTDQLNQKIKVASQTDSQVINLSVQDTNPGQAAQIANTIAGVFQTKVPKIMNVDNVSILAKADVLPHQAPVKPNKKVNIAIGVVVGLMAGLGISLLLEYLDHTVKTDQEIEQLLGLPVLGVIGMIAESNKSEKVLPLNSQEKGESFVS
jgi:capsular polysaccharide biosynthesis protein